MSYLSYYEYNHTNPDYISLDNLENAIESLENVLFELNRKDNMKWKWAAGSLIHSLYSFCIANLTGTNYENVLRNPDVKNEDEGTFIKRGEEPFKKSIIKKRTKGKGYTIEWIDAKDNELNFEKKYLSPLERLNNSENKTLISFWSALARVQDGYGHMNMYLDSKPLVLTEEQWVSIEFLYNISHDFLKFVPKSWGVDIASIIKGCNQILPVIKFLSLESFNFFYTDDDMRDRAEKFLLLIEKGLDSPNEVAKEDILSINLDTIKKEHKIKSYIAMIERGETEQVEFKSSLRYDYNSNANNADLEYEVMKTICAFLNKRGGHLFIGVTNEKYIIGIYNDYKILNINTNDTDNYFQYLRNKVENKFTRKVLGFLEFEIEKLNNKDVCIVIVKKSNYPVYITNKKGEREFYVRSGTSNLKYSEKETKEYIIAEQLNGRIFELSNIE